MLYLREFLCISIFNFVLFVSPTNQETFDFKEKGCTTIKSKQGDFKIVGKDTEKLHTDCVNNLVLEKDGERYCISGKGDDILECKSEGIST